MIHLHKLRLTGPRRQYEVDFDRRHSNLAIIAGLVFAWGTLSAANIVWGTNFAAASMRRLASSLRNGRS